MRAFWQAYWDNPLTGIGTVMILAWSFNRVRTTEYAGWPLREAALMLLGFALDVLLYAVPLTLVLLALPYWVYRRSTQTADDEDSVGSQ